MKTRYLIAILLIALLVVPTVMAAAPIKIIKADYLLRTLYPNGTYTQKVLNVTPIIQNVVNRGYTTFKINNSIQPGGVFSSKNVLIYRMNITSKTNVRGTGITYKIGNKPPVRLYIRDNCWFNLQLVKTYCGDKPWGNI